MPSTVLQATLVATVAAWESVSVSVAVPGAACVPSAIETSPIETRGTPANAGSLVRMRKPSTDVVPARARTPTGPSTVAPL